MALEQQPPIDHSPVFHNYVEAISLSSLLGYFVGMLPSIATIGAIIWYGLMIWDWIEKRRLQGQVVIVPTSTEKDV